MKKLFILLPLMLLLCACTKPPEPAAPPLPEYQITNIDRYYRDGKECRDYAIVLSPDCTDDELLAVARFLQDDGYYRHVFFFYRKIEETTGGYTVAKIDEESDGSLTLKRTGGLIEYRDYFYPDDPASSEQENPSSALS